MDKYKIELKDNNFFCIEECCICGKQFDAGLVLIIIGEGYRYKVCPECLKNGLPENVEGPSYEEWLEAERLSSLKCQFGTVSLKPSQAVPA